MGIWANQIDGSASQCRIEFGSASMSLHLRHGLRAAGLDVVWMEARQVNAARSAMRNKTDKTHARGIAEVLRSGWFSKFFIKSRMAHALRTLLRSRTAVQRKCIDLTNEVRGLFRVFGQQLPSHVDQGSFDERVIPLIEADPDLARALLPLLGSRVMLYRTY